MERSAAKWYFASNTSELSVLGMVFGISIKLVIPPATAARLSVAIVALCSIPGSRKWT